MIKADRRKAAWWQQSFFSPVENYKREKMRSQLGDVAKYEMDDGKIRAMYLFANQTKPDSGMLLRKAGYTGGVYREQYDRLLRTLSGDEDVEDTAMILEEMNVTEEEEITMCELFDQYTRRGVTQGIKQGIEALVITCKELGAGFEETAEKVRLRFHLKEEEIQEHMRQYW